MINQIEMFALSAVDGPPPWADPQKVKSVEVTTSTDRDYVNEAVEVGRMGNNREVHVVTALDADEKPVKHWTFLRAGDAWKHAGELWKTIDANRQAKLAI